MLLFAYLHDNVLRNCNFGRYFGDFLSLIIFLITVITQIQEEAPVTLRVTSNTCLSVIKLIFPVKLEIHSKTFVWKIQKCQILVMNNTDASAVEKLLIISDNLSHSLCSNTLECQEKRLRTVFKHNKMLEWMFWQSSARDFFYRLFSELNILCTLLYLTLRILPNFCVTF